MGFARYVLLFTLVACGGSETPYVTLRIEDPSALGGSATMLVVTDSSGNSTQLAPVSKGFPMTLTLTSERKGPQSVTVDLYASMNKVGTGTASIDFARVAFQTVALVLEAVCSGPACTPPPPGCTSNTQCDDGVFCNGQETCSGGACVSGIAPCAISVNGCITQGCDESADRCATTLDDSVCGQQMVCDAVRGCISPPHACTTTPECDDGLYCNGAETCVSSACVAGTPPTAGNPGTECAPTVCSETYHLATGIAPDGTSCNGGAGACYAGECRASAPPACSILVNPGVFGVGQQLGGTGHEITINIGASGGVHFPASDPNGFVPSWVIKSSNVDASRPRDAAPLGQATDHNFTFYVTTQARITSMRVRTATGAQCRIIASPNIVNAQVIQSTQFATIQFNYTAVPSTDEQKVYFSIDCGDSAAAFRFTDVCLLARP